MRQLVSAGRKIRGGTGIAEMGEISGDKKGDALQVLGWKSDTFWVARGRSTVGADDWKGHCEPVAKHGGADR